MSVKLTRLVMPIPAIDPVDGKIRNVLVAEDKIDRAVEFGMVTTIEMQKTMPEIIRRPRAIWESPKSGALLYVGQPEFMYDFHGEPINYWHGNPSDIFVVLVDGNKFVRDWTWTESVQGDQWQPKGWTVEFSLRVI
jgi:hypothetical protein